MSRSTLFSPREIVAEFRTSPDAKIGFLAFFQRLTLVLSIAYLATFAALGSWIGFTALLLYFAVLLSLAFTLHKLEPSESEPAKPQDEPLVGKKILLVEDTASLRMLGEALLQRAGAEVRTVSSLSR